MSLSNDVLVWLIDDDAIHNMAIEILIKSSGFAKKVVSFNKASEALNQLKNGTAFPDVILLDLNMSDLNGWDFLFHYAQINHVSESTTKIYVLTSSVNREDKRKALENNLIQSFISKPLSLHFFEEMKNSI